jgi:hypothetical protein
VAADRRRRVRASGCGTESGRRRRLGPASCGARRAPDLARSRDVGQAGSGDRADPPPRRTGPTTSSGRGTRPPARVPKLGAPRPAPTRIGGDSGPVTWGLTAERSRLLLTALSSGRRGARLAPSYRRRRLEADSSSVGVVHEGSRLRRPRSFRSATFQTRGRPGEVRIVIQVGVCGTDVHIHIVTSTLFFADPATIARNVEWPSAAR